MTHKEILSALSECICECDAQKMYDTRRKLLDIIGALRENWKMEDDETPETLNPEDIPAQPTYYPKTQRDIIRQYIQNAVDKQITEFELIDDAFKYDTLAQNARSTFSMWFKSEIYRPAYQKAEKRIQNQLKEEPTPVTYYIGIIDEILLCRCAFSVTQKRGDDRVHVYCTLDHDFINHLEQDIYDDMIRYIKRTQPERLKQS